MGHPGAPQSAQPSPSLRPSAEQPGLRAGVERWMWCASRGRTNRDRPAGQRLAVRRSPPDGTDRGQSGGTLSRAGLGDVRSRHGGGSATGALMGVVYRRKVRVCLNCHQRLDTTAARRACETAGHRIDVREQRIWWIKYQPTAGGAVSVPGARTRPPPPRSCRRAKAPRSRASLRRRPPDPARLPTLQRISSPTTS